MYEWTCNDAECGGDVSEMRPMAECDKPGPLCPQCSGETRRVYGANLMVEAYPDGHRRFSELRDTRAEMKEKRKEADRDRRKLLLNDAKESIRKENL